MHPLPKKTLSNKTNMQLACSLGCAHIPIVGENPEPELQGETALLLHSVLLDRNIHFKTE